jgi:hypothetical protein
MRFRSSIRSSPWSSRTRRSAAAPTASRTGNQVLLAALTRAMANASTESVFPAERRRPQHRRRGGSTHPQPPRPGQKTGLAAVLGFAAAVCTLLTLGCQQS